MDTASRFFQALLRKLNPALEWVVIAAGGLAPNRLLLAILTDTLTDAREGVVGVPQAQEAQPADLTTYYYYPRRRGLLQILAEDQACSARGRTESDATALFFTRLGGPPVCDCCRHSGLSHGRAPARSSSQDPGRTNRVGGGFLGRVSSRRKSQRSGG